MQATTSAGILRFNAVFPKSQNAWRIRPIKEPKQYDYYEDLMERTIYMHLNPQLSPTILPPSLPRNIATTLRPSKDELIEQHFSRFLNPS